MVHDPTTVRIVHHLSLIDRFRPFLPVTASTPVVSLGEGTTPLVAAPTIGAALGVDLHLKLEGMNPTGSFKDRGMTLALSKAAEDGAQGVICASTGNTSASAAAYAARAGIRCVVVIPGGKIALGKLSQAQIHGAVVLRSTATSTTPCVSSASSPIDTPSPSSTT